MALTKATAVSTYASASPTITFSVAAAAGDIAVIALTRTSATTAPTLTGTPTGLGGTWTLLYDGGRVTFWVGRGLTSGTVVTCATGRTGTDHRYVGWLVSGVVNPATAVVDSVVGSSAAKVPLLGPAINARNGQFVAAVASFGTNLLIEQVAPLAPDVADTWVRYDPVTSSNTEYISATPTTPRTIPHQVKATSDASSTVAIAQVVIGEYSGPSSTRAYAEHVEALLVAPPANTVVSGLQLQVLMPTDQVAVVLDSMQVQVLIEDPWVVSASDGVTAVQVLHADGVWRPLHMIG